MAPRPAAPAVFREVKLLEGRPAFCEETRASTSEPHAAGVPLKERHTQAIFESADAAADNGVPRAKHLGSAAKTQTFADEQRLGDRDEVDVRKVRLTPEPPLSHARSLVPRMPKLKRGATKTPLSR